MATVKLILFKQKSDKGDTHPVAVRIGHQSVSAVYVLKIHVTELEWAQVKDSLSGSYSNNMGKLAQRLWRILNDYKETLDIYSREYDISKMTPYMLRDEIVRRVEGYAPRVGRTRSFLSVYDAFTQSRDTEGTRAVYRATRSKILAYDPSADLRMLDDITLSWVEGFDASMKDHVSSSTRNLHLRNLRAVMNHAWKKKYVSDYVFTDFRVPKPEPTRKRALTVEQVRTLMTVHCGPFEQEYRDLFLLSLFLIGVNATDILHAKKTDIVNGRFEYRRQKTHKLYSIKVEPEAAAIIEKYEGKNWLLKPLDSYSRAKDYLHHWNDGLGRIGTRCSPGTRREGKPLFPKLTTQWARHTWATIAAIIDLPVDVVGRSLGHSWTMGGITSVYIDYDLKKIDVANRKVIDYILGKEKREDRR